MLCSYQYQLDLNKSQKNALSKSFGCCRWVYNWALNKKIEAYQKNGTQLSWIDICNMLPALKKDTSYIWLTEPTADCLQQSVRNMCKAFDGFFKHKKGFPSYKNKRSKQSVKFVKDTKFDFIQKKIKIPKIGWVRFHCSRTFEGKLGALTVTKNASGKYFASILVDDGKEAPAKAQVKDSTTVGIDVGVKHFAVMTNGERIDNPKYFEKTQKRLSVLQRRLSRKTKGSKRRERAKLSVAKCHYKIANQRKDFLHKLTSRLVSENQTIVVEGLAVENMVRNRKLSKAISSVAWSEFFRQLEYKCEWNGKNLIRIGRYEPSSKMCTCGAINETLTLSDREWTCASCGATHDRDLLAATNIKRIGLLKYSGGVTAGEDVEMSAVVESVKRQDVASLPNKRR